MQQIEHRHWGWMIGVGFALLLGLVLGWIFVPSAQEEIMVMAPTQQEYQEGVVDILAAYNETKDARGTYEALLEVRVPPDAKETHLQLALAFAQLVQGDVTGGALLVQLLDTHDWLRGQ